MVSRSFLTGLVVVALVGSGCDRRQAPRLLEPGPGAAPGAPAPSAYTLSVHVSAPDFSEVSGARAVAVSGRHAGAACVTDSSGGCTLPVTFSESPTPQVHVAASGFGERTVGFPTVTSREVTMFFRLVPDDAPLDLAGVYEVELTPASTCTNRDPVKGRTTLKQSGHSLVLVADGSPSCSEFWGGLRQNAFGLVSDGDCNAVFKQLSSTAYVVGIGRLSGEVQPGTIAARFEGVVVVGGHPWSHSRADGCEAKDHLVRLSRVSGTE